MSDPEKPARKRAPRTPRTAERETPSWSSSKEPAKPMHPPRVSINYDWTADRIRDAFTSADQGKFEGLGDLTEIVMAHPDVSGALGIRRGALRRRTLDAKGEGEQVRALRGSWKLSGTLKPAPASEGQPADEWQAGDIEIIIPASEFARLHGYGVLPQFGIVEGCVHYDAERGRQLLVSRVWNLRHFRKDLGTGKWYVRVATSAGGQGSREQEIVFGERWFMIAPVGTDRPWSSSPLFGLADWWLLGGPYAVSDWGVASERSGKGILSLEADASVVGYDEAKANAVSQRVYDAGKHGVIAPPPGLRLNAVEFDPSTWEIFEAQAKAFRQFVSVSLLGGDLALNASDGGSYAAALAQDPHFQDLVTGDAEWMAQFLTAGPVRVWWRLNYAVGRPTRLFWSVPEDEEARRKAQAELESTEADTAGKKLALVQQASRLAPDAVDVRATLEALCIPGLVLVDLSALPGVEVPAGPGGHEVPVDVQRAAARGRLLITALKTVNGIPPIGPRDFDRRIASTLALGAPVDKRFVSVVDSWFDMNAAAKAGDTGSDAAPTELYVRWLLHGGDPGRKWSTDVMEGGPSLGLRLETSGFDDRVTAVSTGVTSG